MRNILFPAIALLIVTACTKPKSEAKIAGASPPIDTSFVVFKTYTKTNHNLNVLHYRGFSSGYYPGCSTYTDFNAQMKTWFANDSAGTLRIDTMLWTGKGLFYWANVVKCSTYDSPNCNMLTAPGCDHITKYGSVTLVPHTYTTIIDTIIWNNF